MKTEQISMKPEWLRKGNLMINNADGSLIIVKAYDIYCLEEGMDSMIMQPIPLNEYWLGKIGFNHTFLNGPIRINSWCKRIPCEWGNELIIEAKVECIDNGIEAYLIATHARAIRVERKYQYVHQLQNLYYALTGEELTLKT